MNLKQFVAAVFGAVTLVFSPVAAQTAAPAAAAAAAPDKPLTAADLEGLRADLRSSKKQLTAEALTLTDTQATKFWPVYDQYIAELTHINDAKYALIAEYVNTFGKIDDKAATSWITRWLDVDVKATQLRAKYVPIVGRVVPGVTAATFFQIDRRLQMVIDLKLASQLPILQLQSQVAK
jgi:Spy/CpxP family protein refolding chaperone